MVHHQNKASPMSNETTPIPQEIMREIVEQSDTAPTGPVEYNRQEAFAWECGWSKGFREGAIQTYNACKRASPSAAPSAGTFFFAQDDSCHWYMIPTERREEWSKARDLDLETDEGYEEWQKGDWEDYMTGGGIGDIDFIPSPPTPLA